METELVEVRRIPQAPLPDFATQVEDLTRAWPPTVLHDRDVGRIPYATVPRIRLTGGNSRFAVPQILWWGRWGSDVPRHYSQDSHEKNLEEAEYAKAMIPNILPLNIQIELLNY